MEISTLTCAAECVRGGATGGFRLLAPSATELRAAGPGGVRTGLHPGGWHAHGCVEVCFVTAGCCRLWTATGAMELIRGEGVAVVPGTAHCEGWAESGAPYELLWLVIIGDSCSAFVSECDPAAGWRSTGHAARQAPEAVAVTQAVTGLCAAAEPVRQGLIWVLQGTLLAVLGRFMAAVADGPAVAGSSGTRREQIAAQVAKYVELHFAEPLAVADLAALFRLSPNYLNGLFSARYGMGVHAYQLRRRLAAADALLRSGGLLVKEVSHRVGFTDPLYFSRLYKQRYGRPPSARLRPSP